MLLPHRLEQSSLIVRTADSSTSFSLLGLS